MTSIANLTRPPGTQSALLAFGVVLASAALLASVSVVASPVMAELIAPTFTAVALFLLFCVLLSARLGGSVFGELGFIYLAWAAVYTAVPGFGLAAGSADETGPLSLLLPATDELATHLWRHVLFIGSVATGYLLARGTRAIPLRVALPDPNHSSDRMVVMVLGLVVVCIAILLLLSGPVTNYYEHYVRYDHLSWPIRKFVSVCVRLNIGLYSILLVLLFLHYKRYRWLIPVVLIALCVHETTYSLGSRIFSLMILLQAVLLYHLLVRQISLMRAFMICVLLGVLFTAIEFLREAQGDLDTVKSRVSDEGLRTAGEFGAVFLTGFHLYAERAQGSLPATEWPMFFNDFVSLVTFGDFMRWNPMDWYARNYYPDALVAPLTLSPIADSAIWGGELDLLFRGLVNGAFFALIVRCFVRWRTRWWSLVVYAFCYATAIMTLKYSVFYHLTPLLKTMVPVLVVFAMIRWLSQVKARTGASTGAG
ncbi:hypothetical protein [Roseateles sp.]|uniref:hypothetical protein n=1 Tax=Roseateles sp. TaxID=1971397 RepID=UPI003BA41E53